MKKALAVFLVSLAFLTASFGICAPASALSYSFSTLDTLPGDYTTSPADINNAGQVVGSSQTPGGPAAALWNGTTPISLDPLGTAYSAATGINDRGQVVGFTSNGANATFWNGTSTTVLDDASFAAINDRGQIVGSSSGGATLWSGTTTTVLGEGSANDINNRGQVVGSSAGSATLWNGTNATNLGTLPGGTGSSALGINDRGQVVGYSTFDGSPRATLWSGTTPTNLGSLLDGGPSMANDINDRGQIVGWSYTNIGHPSPILPFIPTSSNHATMWNDGAIIDLNSFLDASTIAAGWYLTNAIGINDRGEIIGIARNTLVSVDIYTLKSAAFVLTPVPEPEIYVTLVAGMVVVGWTVRRKRKKGSRELSMQ